MTPVSPVFPGIEVQETVIAKNQPQYLPLPAYRDPAGVVYTRWTLTWRERFRLLRTGNLWLTIKTFGRPLQPVKLDTLWPVNEGFREPEGIL